MPQQTLPEDVADLTQEQYEAYIAQVKAIMLQFSINRVVVTAAQLAQTTDYDIFSTHNADNSVEISISTKRSENLRDAIQNLSNLTTSEKQILKTYL